MGLSLHGLGLNRGGLGLNLLGLLRLGLDLLNHGFRGGNIRDLVLNLEFRFGGCNLGLFVGVSGDINGSGFDLSGSNFHVSHCFLIAESRGMEGSGVLGLLIHGGLGGSGLGLGLDRSLCLELRLDGGNLSKAQTSNIGRNNGENCQ